MNRLREVALATRERFGQDLLHPRVGRERLALDDADGGQRSHQLGVERGGRFLLHDLVEHLVVAVVVRRNGVDHLAAAFVEHGRRRRRDPAQPGLAGQELGDGRADAAGFVGIDLGELPDRFGRRLRIVLVLQERAAEPQRRGLSGSARRRTRPPAAGRRSQAAGSGISRPGRGRARAAPKSMTQRHQ